MTRKQPKSRTSKPSDRTVTLRFGYQVDLADTRGFDHLFEAILGETLTAMRVLKIKRRSALRSFGFAYTECLHELHYVAGQLAARGSSIDLDLLISEFGVWWDDLGEKLNAGDNRE